MVSKTKSCKFCGKGGFHWAKTASDGWHLLDSKNLLHNCKKAKKSSTAKAEIGAGLTYNYKLGKLIPILKAFKVTNKAIEIVAQYNPYLKVVVPPTNAPITMKLQCSITCSTTAEINVKHKKLFWDEVAGKVGHSVDLIQYSSLVNQIGKMVESFSNAAKLASFKLSGGVSDKYLIPNGMVDEAKGKGISVGSSSFKLVGKVSGTYSIPTGMTKEMNLETVSVSNDGPVTLPIPLEEGTPLATVKDKKWVPVTPPPVGDIAKIPYGIGKIKFGTVTPKEKSTGGMESSILKELKKTSKPGKITLTNSEQPAIIKKGKKSKTKYKEGIMKQQPIKLRDALVLYQPVLGSSQGSIYFVVALFTDLKIAVRLKDNQISIRVEGNELPVIKDDLILVGFDMKGDYGSLHVNAPSSLDAGKIMGAVLCGIGKRCKTNIPDINKLIGKGV